MLGAVRTRAHVMYEPLQQVKAMSEAESRHCQFDLRSGQRECNLEGEAFQSCSQHALYNVTVVRYRIIPCNLPIPANISYQHSFCLPARGPREEAQKCHVKTTHFDRSPLPKDPVMCALH